MSDTFTPLVSVVIPLYNDSERLEICLASLDDQTYPKSLYEVIVVDNGSDDDVEELVGRFSQTAFTREDRPGSYAARNKGLSIAKGNVIAFTDSDCIPKFDWIANGLTTLMNTPNCGLVAGRVKLFSKNHLHPTAVEIYEMAKAFDQRHNVEKDKYGVTANLFTYKSVLDNVGPFNSELKSGGDAEWGKRVYSCGYKLAYSEDACVLHPARHSFLQLYNKATRVQGGFFSLSEKGNYSISNIFFDIITLVKSILALFYKFLFNSSQIDNLNGFKQKVQYIIVFAFVKLVYIFEKIRLQTGAFPKR